MVEKISYYDIKLNSPHKDVIVIKGNENECDPILFEGQVKISLNTNVHFKKIKLSLIGEASINYFCRDENGGIKEQIIERLVMLKVDWDNLLVNENGQVVIGKYGDKPIKSYKLKKHHPTNSVSSSTRPGFHRTKSTPMFDEDVQSSIRLPASGVDGTPFKNHPSHHSFLLPQGNYSLPFKVVLPSNICETVEGLTIGKVLYKFESSIQKGLFDKPITKYKYIRIVRTLHPTSLRLTDNIDINNTWPGKVEYKVYLNKKGIALGSKVPIKIIIIPLTKGLRIKQITCEIVQHHHVSSIERKSPEFESVIGSQQILGRTELVSDYWDLTCHYKMPYHLRDLTQTCALEHDVVQVKHRLRVNVQLKNPSGTVSELRANLPVTIYISPNVGHAFGCHAEIDQTGLINLDKKKEDAIFKKDKVNSNTTTPLVSPSASSTNLQEYRGTEFRPSDLSFGLPEEGDEPGEEDEDDEMSKIEAPPMYEQAKFDKVYDMMSPKSPMEQLGPGYFDIPRSDERASTPLDLGILSKVPSYDEAVDEDDSRYDLSPSYDGSSKNSLPNIDDFDLTKSQSYGSLPNVSESLNRSFNNSTISLHQRSRSNFKLQLPKKKK